MSAALFLTTGLLMGIATVFVESAMAEDNTTHNAPEQILILEPESLANKDILATVNIVSKQERMGSGALITNEGKITMGKPILYSLKVPAGIDSQLLAMPNSESWRYYLVVFPFTLHPPPHRRRYQEMTFEIVLSDPRITAFRLLPERVVREEEVTEVFDIGFTISLSGGKDNINAGAEASANNTQTVKFTRVKPVVTAFGDRQNDFYWVFSGISDSPVDPGSRRTAAVLQVPIDTDRLSGIMRWQVDLERSIIEDWLNVPVTVDTLPLELQLN